ncbi:MAG: glycosyltransferase family 4 protein [Holophaga sp.]|nr:glycosyltransferase family 4 protein [Holophaga sp.]
MPTEVIPKSKLLVLCQLFYPEMVSTGQTLTELCCELSDRAWDIEVVCASPTVQKAKEPVPSLLRHHDITIRRVWATRFPKLNILGRIINQATFTLSTLLYLLFRSGNRKILVLTNPPFLPFACVVAKCFRPKLKFALLVFDVYPDTAIHLQLFSKTSLPARLWDWLNERSFSLASKIIVIGRCMKEVILGKGQRGGLDLRPKMEMVHIWSDDQAIANTELVYPDVFAKHGLQGKFIILYSGNMGRFHDVDTILEAALALRSHPRIRFAFVGEGAKKQDVIAYIDRHALPNCIVDTYVPKEELGSLLRCANAGLATLLPGQEGLSVPSKTLGLMAAGLPVLAIMDPKAEIALLVKEAQFGRVIASGDVKALVQTLLEFEASPNLCKELGERGLELVRQTLSLTKAADRYSEILKAM